MDKARVELEYEAYLRVKAGNYENVKDLENDIRFIEEYFKDALNEI
jgi:hypothetical protein